MTAALSIQQGAATCGLSVHTLRYYERIGLIRPVPRRGNGHRRYRADDMGWIAFLVRLRATGMSVEEMGAMPGCATWARKLPASPSASGCCTRIPASRLVRLASVGAVAQEQSAFVLG